MAEPPPEQPSSGGGATLGFSLAAKPKRAKVQVQVAQREEERQLITGIEGTRIRTAAPEAQAAGPRVIASLGNTYRAGVGFVPSFKPPSSEDPLASSNQDRFVAAPQIDTSKPVVAQYGLVRMGAAAAADSGGGGAADGSAPAAEGEQQHAQGATNGDAEAAAPSAAAARPAFAARGGRGDNKQQLMEELEALPEALDAEEYEATPVDEFAKALLRGMGWREGEGVGRNKQSVEVKQIVPRPERLGLGADPAALPSHLQRPRVVKMGERLCGGMMFGVGWGWMGWDGMGWDGGGGDACWTPERSSCVIILVSGC